MKWEINVLTGEVRKVNITQEEIEAGLAIKAREDEAMKLRGKEGRRRMAMEAVLMELLAARLDDPDAPQEVKDYAALK